jgi:hypothetical protein
LGACLALALLGGAWVGGPSTAGVALALIPLFYLMRFLGCEYDPPAAPGHLLQLGAIFPPTAPVEQFSARLALFSEPALTEIEDSPLELLPKAPLPNGSLVFEAVAEVPAGAYRAVCIVESPTQTSRIGVCSGEVRGPLLAVIFLATPADLPNALPPLVCFEPSPA